MSVMGRNIRAGSAAGEAGLDGFLMLPSMNPNTLLMSPPPDSPSSHPERVLLDLMILLLLAGIALLTWWFLRLCDRVR
jgi:hypothetical protein